MPTPGFKQVDKGGPVVYDIAGDGSLGYCYGVGIITGSLAAVGSPASGNPLLVGLKDTGGNVQFIAGDTSGNQFAVGNIASGVADAGNPVKVGGKALSGAASAVTNLQRVDAWFDLSGRQVVAALSNNGVVDGNTTALLWQAQNNGASLAPVVQSVWNGASYDRQRNNTDLTILASAARTTTAQGTSADQINYNGKRLLLVVDVSVVGTGSITPSLQVKDSISGNYFTVWTAAAAVVTGATFAYYFADGAGAGGTFTEKLPFGLPSRTWRVVCTHNNANSITYSASGVTGL